MDLPRILPLDNEERIRTLMCDGVKTRGITDQCLGLVTHQRRHTQVGAKIATSTTFAAAANSESHHHQSNSESPYPLQSRSLFFNG